MVAHRSPKPPVWVRILLPLPKLRLVFLLTFFYSLRRSFLKNFSSFYISILFIIIIFSFFCIIPTFYTNSNFPINTNHSDYFFSNADFYWPTPGYHTITSYFGKRISPTTGASTNHSGIDIAASEGSSIFSILSGKVTYTDFYGANGHTIIIESLPYTIKYSHISPNYIVKKRRFYSKRRFNCFCRS